MARSLLVRLLGDFTVEIDGEPVPDEAWRRRRAAALVKLLALAPNHRLPRDQAIEALWPDLDPQAGGANLRKTAYHVRRTVGLDDAVVLDGVTVSLLPSGRVVTDVAAFEALAEGALRKHDTDAARRAADRYAGDLLPDDRYEEWTHHPRERLRRLHLQVVTTGRLWGRLLAFEPTSELAHREILRERLERGDRAGAIRQFDLLRRVLRDELGVSPDPETLALYERVLGEEEAEAPTPAERARALLAWGTVHWQRSELDEAERSAAQVRALAVDAGLGRELAEASELLAFVAYAQGRWREVFARDFLETARSHPELAPFVYDANLCFSEFALHEPGGLSGIADFASALVAAAEEGGSPQARALGLLLRGEVGLFGGEAIPVVRRQLADAVALHENLASTSGLALATERLAEAESVAGRGGAAEELHRRALQRSESSAVANHLLPLVYGGMLQDVPPAEGLPTLEEADAALSGRSLCDPCSMSFRLGAAAVRACAGHHEAAHSNLAEAARIAAMWDGGPWHAALAEARATVARAGGASASECRLLLETAAAGFAAAGRPRDAARCAAAVTRH